GYDPTYDPAEQYASWYEEQQQADQYRDQYEEEPPLQEPSPEETGSFPIPVVPGGRTRELGEGGAPQEAQDPQAFPGPRQPQGQGQEPDEEALYQVFKQSIHDSFPTPREFGENIEATFGTPLQDAEAKHMVPRVPNRSNAELEENHIAGPAPPRHEEGAPGSEPGAPSSSYADPRAAAVAPAVPRPTPRAAPAPAPGPPPAAAWADAGRCRGPRAGGRAARRTTAGRS